MLDSYSQTKIMHAWVQVAQDIGVTMQRPCVVFKPDLFQDGDKWIACKGPNIQVGVVGVGNSPDEAMKEFDKAWYAPARVPQKD